MVDNPLVDGADPSPGSAPSGYGNVTWLERREQTQLQRVNDEELNSRWNVAQGAYLDVGEIKASWAFVFRLGVKDHKAPKEVFKARKDHGPKDHIPLEVWQFCHRLWKHDFHITHHFSTLGNLLIVRVGLPYKALVDEATKMRIKMRLKRTKGMHGFQPTQVERYAQRHSEDEETRVFSSATRQSLTLYRLKYTAHIVPETMPRHKVSRSSELGRIRSKFKSRQHIRGRDLTILFALYGCYRPWAETVFGAVVKQMSLGILEDPWLMLLPPEKLQAREAELKEQASSRSLSLASASGGNGGKMDQDRDVMALEEVLALEEQLELSLNYDDIGVCLDSLEAWAKKDSDGNYESFSGSFDDYFPLHDKVHLYDLAERWATFTLVKTWAVQGKDAEFKSLHSFYHPDNVSKQQFGPLYQPLDEIRDYFGDHVAVYFCWMDLYTCVLIWPAGLGVIGMLMQIVYGSVDHNPFTIPYSIFFAAWSMVFLSSWQRRANELRFLWGTDGFAAREAPRAQFRGLHVVNPETHRDDLIYDPSKSSARYGRLAVGYMISFTYICFTIYCAIKATLIKDHNRLTPTEFAAASLTERYKFMAISAFLNLTIIAVYGAIYELIAEALTKWENHRTSTEYEDSVIRKNFLFQFVNNYFVLFYISVIRPFMSSCQIETVTPLVYVPNETGSFSGWPHSSGSWVSAEDKMVMVSAETLNVDASMCRQSDLSELQFQLFVVFTGKTLGWRMGSILKPKLSFWAKEMLMIMKLDLDMLKMLDSSYQRQQDTSKGIEMSSTKRLGMKLGESTTTPPPSAPQPEREREFDSDTPESAEQLPASHERQTRFGSIKEATVDVEGKVEDELEHIKEVFVEKELKVAQVLTKKKDSIQLYRDKLAHRQIIQEQLRKSYESDDKVEDEYAMTPCENTFDEFNEMAVQVSLCCSSAVHAFCQ